MWESGGRITLGALGLVLWAAGCTPFAAQTLEPGVEHMPGPAAVWLTSDPAVPAIPVPVTMTSPDEADILFSHTFVPRTVLRGDFATSQGRYRLAAFHGECALDLNLGPSEVVDVELTISESGCGLAILRVGSMDDPAMWKDESGVLITNHNVGDATPAIEPGPSASP